MLFVLPPIWQIFAAKLTIFFLVVVDNVLFNFLHGREHFFTEFALKVILVQMNPFDVIVKVFFLLVRVLAVATGINDTTRAIMELCISPVARLTIIGTFNNPMHFSFVTLQAELGDEALVALVTEQGLLADGLDGQVGMLQDAVGHEHVGALEDDIAVFTSDGLSHDGHRLLP